MKGKNQNNTGAKRRYNSYTEWFNTLFGKRVQKVSINAGFTCPNRDGTLGLGGCTYCNNEAFIPGYCTPDISVTEQIQRGIAFHQRRYRRAESYLAYFQAYTNTYSDIGRLKAFYDEALSYPGVLGLVIGTRPDCIDNDLLDYLAEVSRDYFVMVEYGLESTDDKVLKHINRGHDFASGVRAVTETAEKGIYTGAHFIFGLPGESREHIIDSSAVISALPLSSLKIRQLQLVKGTLMAEEYRDNPAIFDLYTLEEYLDLVVAFCERISPSLMIERISGEAPAGMLDDPRDWHMRSNEIFRLFEERLEKKDTWQGRLYNK